MSESRSRPAASKDKHAEAKRRRRPDLILAANRTCDPVALPPNPAYYLTHDGTVERDRVWKDKKYELLLCIYKQSIKRQRAQRHTQAQAMTRETLEQLQSADRTAVERGADAEADFQRAKHAIDMEMKAKKRVWDSVNKENAAALGNPVRSPERADNNNTWSEDFSHWATSGGDDNTGIQQDWQGEAYQYNEWDSFDDHWGTDTATWNTEAQQEDEWAVAPSAYEEPIAWMNGERSSDSEYSYGDDENDTQDLPGFSFADLSGEEAVLEDSELPRWDEVICASKPVEEKQEEYPGAREDDKFLFCPAGCDSVLYSTKSHERMASKDMKICTKNEDGTTNITMSAASSLPTPPPSPKVPMSSLQEKPALTSDQALTRIGRLKADVHFEEHASKLLSSLEKLRDSRAINTWELHRYHRDSWSYDTHIRDAETAEYLARFALQATAFNILATPDRKNYQHQTPSFADLAQCGCRGQRVDGHPRNVEKALRCKINYKRARQKSRRACACANDECVGKRCSGLRNGITTEDV